MKKYLVITVLMALNIFFAQAQENYLVPPVKRIGNTSKKWITQTPPMGWNSYNSFGTRVTEKDVKLNADYLEKNLKKFGWQYVVVDFLWFVDTLTAQNYQSKTIPQLIDEFGRVIPATNLHPSAAGGKGFKPLADYVHSKGLKFGVHLMRGIPWQAVERNITIKGTKYKARDIIYPLDSCDWYKGMIGINFTKPGAQEYYNSIFENLVKWGVDFVKYDDMSYPYHAGDIEAVQTAIKKSGRPMVFSLSPGPAPIGFGSHLSRYANLWRISKDFWDNWTQLKEQFNYARLWSGYYAKGSYPDLDMLSLGKLAKASELVGNKERFIHFTKDEQYIHMTLWAIFRSPLMFGGNLPENDAFTLSLLNNEEILKVNQRGINSRELKKAGNTIIWVSEFPGTKALNVAFFNLDDHENKLIEVSLKELGINGKYTVRDLWEKKDKGTTESVLSSRVNIHGAKIFTLTPLEKFTK
jgi:hypothetical protein